MHLRYVTLSMHHICADGFPGYEEGFGTRTYLYTLQDFETDDDGFSLWVLSWVSSPRRRLTRHRTDLRGGMNVVPASQSSPVSTFISMSWRGRSFSSLHPLRSVLFLPLNSQLVCRRRGRLQLPYSPLHRPLRPWFHMAHDHQFDVSLFMLVLLLFLAAHPRGGSMCFTYWHCLARPSVVPISLRSLGFRFVSALVRYITLGAYSNHGPVRLLSGASRHGRT